MKCLLRLLPCLLAWHGLAQPQTASVTGYCRSLCLESVTTTYGGASSFNFTTAKGAPGQLHFVSQPDGTRLYSNELRPVAGRTSQYESDFELMSGNTPVYDGTLSLTFPLSTVRTNPSNIPAALDCAQPMYCEVLGAGSTTYPSSNSFRLNLRFNRAAGSASGAFSGVWALRGANYIMTGALRLMLLEGSAGYTRGRTNLLQLQLTRSLPGDSANTVSLSGTVAYTASANQISLPRFSLTDSQHRLYTVRSTVLNRHGNRYLGELKFVDGAPETPWPDYVNWILALTDTNDSDGNGIPDISDPSAVHIPSAPLIVTTSGAGTVSPALSGRNLELGKSYRLTATPAKGYSFSGWTGGIISSSRVLLFPMQTNLALQANFVPNPFYAVRGTYYGLLEDTNNPSNQSLGAFSATTTDGGTYSAKFQLGGQTFSVSGAFDASGSTYPVLVPRNLRPLFVELHLDLANGSGISGSIGDGVWLASINANKSPFKAGSNPCAFAGKYTFANPSWGFYGELPLAHSYGTVKVDAAGRIRCSVWLADGTRATQTTMMSGTGDWPFYVSLYGRKGCLGGWLTFTNLNESSEAYGLPVSGHPMWVKPAATAKYAPEGFTNRVMLLLAPYAAPRSGMPATGWTNGLISFKGGNLEAPFKEVLAVGSHNKLASTSNNKLTLRVLANGLFQGRVTPPDGSRPVSFQGAFLQQAGSGFGHWLGASQSGAVDFGPLVGGPGPGLPSEPPFIRTNVPIPGVPTFTNDTGVIFQRLPPRPSLPTNIITQPLTNVPVVLVTNPLPPLQLNTNPLMPIYTPIPGYSSGAEAVSVGGASATVISVGSLPWYTYPSAGASLQRTTHPIPRR